MDMNNMLISSAKKDEELENYVKCKRKELEKMIPGFINDKKFNEIVLDFYERGIRDGIDFGMIKMKQRMMKDSVASVFIQNYGYGLPILEGDLSHKCGLKSGNKVKLIIIKED